MQKNKIILFFPDGVGIRNYLYSKVFQNAEEDLVLFHNFDSATVSEIRKHTDFSQEMVIPEYKESFKEKFLRELICLSRLIYNSEKVKNPTILTNWNWNQQTLSKKIFYKIIEKTVFFYRDYSSILKLEKRYQKEIRKNPFYHDVTVILKEINPQSIFCAHQRGLKGATIFAAAQDLNIKSTTVIYSWDNLPKARLALRADQYLVWSDYMKKEMELYYPEISQQKVIVTGTPQFEFYDDLKNIIEKETFYKTYDLDPNKKIICFSGDDEKTSPDDPKYLNDIAQEIMNSKLQDEFQILLRRCPVDISGRFDKIISQYNGLIKEAAPIWHFNSASQWTTIYPTMDDVKLLTSTAYYSDLVINVGSTMAFDFAMYNKPCIFINYDQEDKEDKNWSTKTIYQFQHFRSMPQPEKIIWLNKKEEIYDKILQTKQKSEYINKWRRVIVSDALKSSVEIKNAISNAKSV
jgi:hypothetical protein